LTFPVPFGILAELEIWHFQPSLLQWMVRGRRPTPSAGATARGGTHGKEEGTMHHRRFAAMALALVIPLAGCAKSENPAVAPSSSPSSSAAPAVTGGATIFAAASLTESFNQIGDAFEKAHPGTNLTFSFGSSGTLATQIVEGGGVADVFASADDTNMKKVADANLLEGASKVFARNKLQIAVAPGNPEKIMGLKDLAKPGLKVVLAAATVPVGKYGAQALQKAGVTVKPVSEEADVKAVLQKVALGEADAGIVYQTDVKSSGKVQGVDIPDDLNVIATYPIGVINKTKNPAVAEAFEDMVLSDAGRQVLMDHGFLGP
jgi:molybdate transport system substrate-binding protein